jgi:Cellulase (glycosyl hydrolase family 5)
MSFACTSHRRLAAHWMSMCLLLLAVWLLLGSLFFLAGICLSSSSQEQRATQTMALDRVKWNSSLLSLVSASVFEEKSLHGAQTSASLPSLRTRVAGIASLRGMNYYPSMNGWYYMWTNWDPATMASDFTKIASTLHANCVRIIVPADEHFGYPTPYSNMLKELSQAITLADQQGLQVDLTLFDSFSSYSDLSGSKQWAAAVVSSYRNDPRIAYIDLHNELDNTDASAVAWAKTMIPYVHGLAGNIPITVSVTHGISNLALQVANQVPVDFYNFHYYGDPDQAYSVFQQALQTVGTANPLLIGETGDSTFNNTEAQQKHYFRIVERAARQSGLPFASPWIYSDFADQAHVPSGVLGTAEQYFGLYRADGTLKPAGAKIARLFQEAGSG